MYNPARLQRLFDKYLQRRCNPQELEELIALLQEAEADNLLSPQMQEVWEQLKGETTSYDVDWENMYNTIRTTREIEPVRSSRVRRYWYAIAASILLIFAAAAWYMQQDKKEVTPDKFAEEATTPKPKPQNSMRQTIHLPDGSTVVLNANSRLNYPPSFSGSNREVFLSGEAFFDIKPDAQKPFLVHTGRITTRVLGTAFNIKAYSTDKLVEVTVTRGKVQVLKDNRSLGLLTASQQISCSNDNEKKVLQKTVDIRPVIAWKPEEIYFNDITMEEALKQISERFSMEVVFANAVVKPCRVTATFSGDDQPDEILAVICAVSKATYTINGNKIIIDGKGCN
jgi:transmembrane sensor